MKKLAQVYALNQWLYDYPPQMDYEEIVKILNKDNDESTDFEWEEVGIAPWYLLGGHNGAQIAQFIEDTCESALRLLERSRDVLKPVATFAYDEENEVWEQLVPGVAGVELYRLDNGENMVQSG